MGPITSEGKKTPNKTTVFKATIRLDYKEVHIDKKEFGFLELLVKVGGLSTMLRGVFMVVAKLAARQAFMNSILG